MIPDTRHLRHCTGKANGVGYSQIGPGSGWEAPPLLTKRPLGKARRAYDVCLSRAAAFFGVQVQTQRNPRVAPGAPDQRSAVLTTRTCLNKDVLMIHDIPPHKQDPRPPTGTAPAVPGVAAPGRLIRTPRGCSTWPSSPPKPSGPPPRPPGPS